MSSENTKAKWIAIAVVGAIIAVIALTSKANAQVTPQSVWRLLGTSISTNVGSWKAGVGTTTPNAKLVVQGNAGATVASNPFNVASSTGAPMFTVKYDGTILIPGNLTLSGTCTGCSGSVALDDLSDVVITSPAYGNVLAYTGANWAKMSTSTLFGQNLTSLGTPTFAGAALGTSDLTITGSIGATGARVTKLWAANVESTGMYTVGGTSLSSTFSPIAGSASIVTTGAISSGSWAATAIPNTKGGTGQDSSGWTGVPLVTAGTWASNAITGTGNVVFSASPTLTGTIGAASQTLSGTLSVTGLGTFVQASSTRFSIVDTLYAGGTATTTINSLGRINVAGASTTPQRDIVYNTATCAEALLTDGATVTWNLATASCARVILGGARTLDITNETVAIGQSVRLVVCQDGTGSRTLAPDAAILWAGGTAPTLTTTANKCDTFAGFTTAATGTTKVFLGVSANF